MMNKKVGKALALATGALTLPATALLLGCSSMFGGGQAASSTPSAPTAHHGEVTFVNASSHAVCRLELQTADAPRAVLDRSVAPGASTTFPIGTDLRGICVVGCGDTGLLYGPPPSASTQGCTIDTLVQSRIELHDAGAGATTDASRLVLNATPTSLDASVDQVVERLTPAPSAAMNGMREAGMAALREYARQRRYPERWLALRVVSNDWTVQRHRATGVVTGRTATGLAFARFEHSDGHCQATAVNLVQVHDGSDFVETVTANGLGGPLFVPCSVAEHAAGRADYAP